MSTARVAIGAPLYNHADELGEAVESLLLQTHQDFRLVCVDDQSTDGTEEVVREYSALDSRITYTKNPRRLGMIGIWRRAFELALEAEPDAEYFAWASDHDVWHPRWLETLVRVLDERPEVVLAYPRNWRIGPDGLMTDKRPWEFDTTGVENRRDRFRRTMRHMSAGNMIYALGRADAIRRAGIFRHVLVPDRLLLMELSLEGQFHQVSEMLWFRRWYGPIFSLGRQRRAFFPDGRPLYAYLPWWIGHAASLTWTLGVRAERSPEIGRATGARLGARYLWLAGLLHAQQQLKQVRIDILERAVFLKPLYIRARGTWRGIERRRADTAKRWRRSFGSSEKRRKLLQRVRDGAKKRVKRIVFPVGRAMLQGIRALPLMRSVVVPWLAREEIDQVPSGPEVFAMRKTIKLAAQGDAPIVVGPWLSEVGFEVLYWIPFLAWAVEEFEIPPERLIVVSRGGAHVWYRDIAAHHEDIFDMMTVKQFRKRNEARWADGGNQKQMAPAAFDEYIVKLVQERRGLEDVNVLHPSAMYRLLRYYWYEKGAISLLNKHTVYRPLPAVETEEIARVLPSEYVAVRFYFRPSFPDTPENRALVGRVIRSLARRAPVVLLNTGLSLDDHEDFHPETGMGIHSIEHLMTPSRNLSVQSAVIAGARMFVGTYGGLSYLGPFYGVPAIALFSNEAELVATHVDVSRRLSRRLEAPLVTLDVREVAVLQMLFDTLDLTPDTGAETVDSAQPKTEHPS